MACSGSARAATTAQPYHPPPIDAQELDFVKDDLSIDIEEYKEFLSDGFGSRHGCYPSNFSCVHRHYLLVKTMRETEERKTRERMIYMEQEGEKERKWEQMCRQARGELSDDESADSETALVMSEDDLVESRDQSNDSQHQVPIDRMSSRPAHACWSGQLFDCRTHLSGGSRYSVSELLDLCPNSFRERSSEWDDMVNKTPKLEEVVPVIAVLQSRATVAVLKRKLALESMSTLLTQMKNMTQTVNAPPMDEASGWVPTAPSIASPMRVPAQMNTASESSDSQRMHWTLEFCRFPGTHTYDYLYANAQVGRINLHAEVIDANEQVRKYRFPRTLIVGSTLKFLGRAKDRLNKIVNDAYRQHPASAFEDVVTMIDDVGPRPEEIHYKISGWEAGRKQVLVCTPRCALAFVDLHVVERVYMMNLKEADRAFFTDMVRRLCEMRLSRLVRVTIMFDREDGEMVWDMGNALQDAEAVMDTPMWSIGWHMALLGC